MVISYVVDIYRGEIKAQRNPLNFLMFISLFQHLVAGPIVRYSQISEQNETDFSIWLTKNHKVTAIPVSAFYAQPDAFASNHKLVRFCFAKEATTLDLAIERLMQV